MFDPCRYRVRGPLAPHRDAVWAHLLSLGYTRLSARNLLYVLGDLSKWMHRRGYQPQHLGERRLAAYVAYRRETGFVAKLTVRSLAPLLESPAVAGLLPPATVAARTPQDEVVDAYRRYEEVERRHTRGVVEGRERIARRFLEARFGSRPFALASISAEDVSRFMLGMTRSTKACSMPLAASNLRAFLRYLHLAGLHPLDLSTAVLATKSSRLKDLPQAISADNVRKLLRTCDRRTHVGRRNHAILLILARLGLRRSEVAGLDLEDVRWACGEVVVRGKGREDRMPLPHDVGEAIASYLRCSRPRKPSRRVFLGVRAPHRDLAPGAITDIVLRAAVKAELTGISPHVLRHTAATQMLRQGASLDEVAIVLRHKHLATTTIYAKVDVDALRSIAQPWPVVLR